MFVCSLTAYTVCDFSMKESEESDELKKGYLDLDGFIEFFRSLPELRGKVCINSDNFSHECSGQCETYMYT